MQTNQTLLVVDQDSRSRDLLALGLKRHGIEVVGAACGAEAIGRVSLDKVSCLLLDANLPDLEAESVVGAICARRLTKWILMGTSLTVPEAVRAMRLGAYDVLQKPLDLAMVAAAVIPRKETAAPSTGIRLQPNGMTLGHRPVAEKWARHVLDGCEADSDPKTLSRWSRIAGVSYTILCEHCRMIDVRPSRARDFVRVLRALLRAPKHRCRPEALLEVLDRRTLLAMLSLSGVEGGDGFRNYSVAAFLKRQRFIRQGNEGLQVLSARLAANEQVLSGRQFSRPMHLRNAR